MNLVYLVALVLSTSMAGVLGFVAWQRRSSPGALALIGIFVSIAAWNGGSLLQYLSVSPREAIFWTRMQFLVGSLVPVFLILFAIQFSDLKHGLNRSVFWLLITEPVFLMFIAAINADLIWPNTRVIPGLYTLIVQYEFGLFFWLHMIYFTALISAAYFLLIQVFYRTAPPYRLQTTVLLLGVLIPWVGAMLHTFNVNTLLGLDPTPFLFLVCGPTLILSFRHNHLLETLPVSYDTIADSLDNGLVVLNHKHQVVSLNRKAEQIINEPFNAVVARPARLLLPGIDLEAILAQAGENETRLLGPTLESPKADGQFYEIRLVQLNNQSPHSAGWLVEFHNITEHKRLEETLNRRAEELLALNETLLEVSNPRELPALLQMIVERATKLLNARSAGLFLMLPSRMELRCEVVYEVFPGLIGKRIRLGQGAVGLVAQTGEPLLIDDYSTWAQRLNTPPDMPNLGPLLCVPLIWQTQVTGVIFVTRLETRIGFTTENVKLLTVFARQAAIAVERARLFEAERRQRAQANTLREMAEAMGLSFDSQQVISKVVAAATSLQLAERVGIFLWSEHRGGFIVTLPDNATSYAGPLSQEQYKVLQGLCFTPHNMPLVAEIKSNPVPLIIPDAFDSSLIPQKWLQFYQMRSVLVVPLQTPTQFLGALYLDFFRETHEYTPEEVELAVALGRQATLALERANLLEAARQRAQEAETLRQATAAVAATLHQDEAIERILEQLARVVPYDSASVQLLKDGFLEIVGGRGWRNIETVTGMRFPVPGNNPNTRVIEKRAPYIISNMDAYPSFAARSTRHIRSWLGVPLIVHDRVIGMLAVDSAQENSFTTTHARLVGAFADQVAIAIENAQLYAEAEQRANELGVLFAAAQDLTASMETKAVLEMIARHIAQATGATSSYILEIDVEEGTEIVLADYYSDQASSVERISDVGQTYPLNEYSTALRAYERGDAVCIHVDSPYATPHERKEMRRYGVCSALIIPLISHGKWIGVVEAWESRRKREFTPVNKRLAQAIAQHAAAVIENVRLYAKQRQRAGELDALRQTMADISMEMELPQLLKAILERAVGLLEATGGDLGIFKEETRELEIVASYNMGKDYTGLRMAQGEGAMGTAIQSLAPVIVEDYKTWERRSSQYDDTPCRATIAVPMSFGRALVGALGIIAKEPDRKFSLSDQNMLLMFGQQAAIAIQNARLYQEARTASQRREILHKVSQEIIGANLDPEVVYSMIHRAAAKLMPAEAFGISIVDTAQKIIRAVYLVDRSGRAAPVSFPLDKGLSGRVVSTGHSLYVPNYQQAHEDDSIHFGDPYEVSSILAVPMSLGEKVIGVLLSESYTAYAYTEEDRYLLEMLAAYAAIALENMRLFQEVQHLAVTDPLTGVYNRRQFFVLGQREFNRAVRYNCPLAAMMLDMDFYKAVNDSYGHLIGDQILIMLTNRIIENIRSNDILSRYGGDEFAILLVESDLGMAQTVAERLRQCIGEVPFKTSSGDITLTVSIGVAVYTPQILSLEDLIDRADNAAYAVKQSGRNRVEIAG